MNNIQAGAEIHSGDGGYSEGTREDYEAFVKVRNQSLGNHRIKELYEQAQKSVAFLSNSNESKENIVITKFARLIVRECLDKIETHRIPVGNSTAGEMACEWTYSALMEIRDEIKQHFGVEE